MADNVAITAGSGTSIATDDVGSVHYQRVKLALGADGVASDAPVGGGVESGALRVTVASDSTGVLSVDDNGGSLTVDGTVTASNAAGDVAHDAADSGNPIKIGGKARTANPTNVAANDRSHIYTDPSGRLITREGQPRDLIVSQFTNTSTTGGEVTVLSAGGAGVYHDLVSVMVATRTLIAAGSETHFLFRSVSSGTTRFSITLGPETPSAMMTFPRPLPQESANGAWVVIITTSGGGVDVDISMVAEKNTA